MKYWKSGASVRRYRFTVRQKLYMIAFIMMMMFSSPLVAHADILGYRIMDVYAEITENVRETNDILQSAFEFAKLSPYSIVNGLFYHHSPQEGVLRAVHNASMTAGLAVATLLLFVDFFRKTVNFEWSSKWENVLLFLIKILVMKQVVQNADVIISSLYALFNYVNDTVIGAAKELDFLPCGRTVNYYWTDEGGILKAAVTQGWWNYWQENYNASFTYKYVISKDAVEMFYPGASAHWMDGFADAAFGADRKAVLEYDLIGTGIDDFENPTTTVNFMPTLHMILIQPYFWILKACAYLVYVITIGRVFELCLYTLFAPLPLATFASETTHDAAKNFLKSYIAVVLQVAVILAMFSVYVAVTLQLGTMIRSSTGMAFLKFVALLALAAGVMKSSAWSKKICGIG